MASSKVRVMQGLHLTADLYHCRCAPAWLTESHLCVHTGPEKKTVTLDGYVCNFGGDPSRRAQQLMQALIGRFAPEWTEQRSLDRGTAA